MFTLKLIIATGKNLIYYAKAVIYNATEYTNSVYTLPSIFKHIRS